jgi:hypothetical protein
MGNLISDRPMCPVYRHRMGLGRISPGERGFEERTFEAPPASGRKDFRPRRSLEVGRGGLARQRIAAAAVTITVGRGTNGYLFGLAVPAAAHCWTSTLSISWWNEGAGRISIDRRPTAPSRRSVRRLEGPDK